MIHLKDIASRVQGRLIGDENLEIKAIASITDAQPGDITYLSNPSLKKHLKSSSASAVIIGSNESQDVPSGMGIIIANNPTLAYIKVAQLFSVKNKQPTGKNPHAIVSDEAKVSDKASVGSYVYIGTHTIIEDGVVVHPFVHIGNNVTIGRNTIIYPNVTLYDNTAIGCNVIIHAGTVVGSDGFGYAWDGSEHVKIPHLGQVVIQDDVEIGANVTIDRAPLGQTVIGKGTKIDNLVQVAHGVVIGEHSIIISQVGISGSVTIGRNVVLAGQTGVRDHAVIGDNVMAAGRTGITGDVPPHSIIAGNPHMPHKEWLRLSVYIKKLPHLFQRLKKIENKLHLEDSDD